MLPDEFLIVLCRPKSIRKNRNLRPKLAVLHHQSMINLCPLLVVSHIPSQYLNIYINGRNRMVCFVIFLVSYHTPPPAFEIW